MPTYSPNLGLILPIANEYPGTWGQQVNDGVSSLLETAVSGYTTQAITDGADTVITIPNGSTGVARNMYIECTGALTNNRNLIVPANRKLYFIFNNTTGNFAVTVKVTGLTGVSVPAGAKMLLVSNGTDVVNAVNYFNLTSVVASGNVTAAALIPTGSTVPANGVYLPSANYLGFASNTTARGGINSSGAWIFNAPSAGAHIVNILAGSNGITFSTPAHSFLIYSDNSTFFGIGTTTTIPVRFLCNNAVVATFASGGGFTIAAPTTTTIPALVAAGGAATTPVAVTFNATTMTVNCALSNVFATTFTANVTVAPTISNPSDGQTINWFITQDATGSRAMTWPASFRFPGGAAGNLLSTAANSVDLLVATYRSTTGFWYATLSKAFVA